ncbi:MAG: hypothetical protein M1816_005522 [Peltula sp. TS41687]|nr:MAG: hypothetical protein M1816_005522 [Peltula sp. TS41687]
MIPKTLFTAFVSLQMSPGRLPLTPSHGMTAFDANPVQQEFNLVIQAPTTLDHRQPAVEEVVTRVNWDGFPPGHIDGVDYAGVKLASASGFVVATFMLDAGWEFPSKRAQAWSINPSTDRHLTIKYTDHPRDNINMTLSYWDYKDPIPIMISMEVLLKGEVVHDGLVNFKPGWNDFGLKGFSFDEIQFVVLGNTNDYRDLLMIDELFFVDH